MKRKDFLKKSATAVAAGFVLPSIIPASALGKDGSTAPSDRIVIGCIGVGGMGSYDMRKFLSREGIQYVAVCDADSTHNDAGKETVDAHYDNKDCRTYMDYNEFLEKEKLDAVHIATPDHWHALISIAAMDKGLAVYGQKPLARTIKDGRAIVDAAKKNNTVWQTGSQQRSIFDFHKACELVRNGRIGKVKYVEVGLPEDGGKPIGTPPVQEVPEGLNWDLWLGPAPKVPYRGICHHEWRWMMDYSGGELTDWAGHHVDIALWGLGMERTGPIEVQGKGVYPLAGIYNVPIEYDFTCKYENGVTIRIANRSELEHGQGASWFGEDGWIHVSRQGLYASDDKILEEVIGDDEIKLYKSEHHQQNFLDCIRSGKETVAPVDIGHNSIATALLGEIAMLTEKKLLWDPKKEVFTNDENANRLLSRPYRAPYNFK
jgi:predicted dehydrogenase